MSAAAQQMNMLKSLRNKRAPSRTNTAPVPRSRNKPPPLPPCPKQILPETSADSGDPYNCQSNSIFKCGVRGFKKWYDKETWKFFDDEDSLYFTRSPRSRKRAISAGAAGHDGITGPKKTNINEMSVSELTQHIKDMKKASKKQAQRHQINGKVGGSDWVEKQYKEKKQQKQHQKVTKKTLTTSSSMPGSVQNLIEQAQPNKPKPDKKKIKQINKFKASTTTKLSTPAPVVVETNNETSSVVAAANSAAERLVSILSSFKALKLCIEAGQDPTSDTVGYDLPTENDIAQGMAFIRKQVASFDTRAWAVARAGGVGSISVLVYHYATVRKSLVPWITDALSSLTIICNLLFDATRKGTAKKGLKRTLKLDLVVTVSAIVIVTAVVPERLKIQAAPILNAALQCLRVFTDELCPPEASVDSLSVLFKGQEDFAESGGLHALLLVNCYHSKTSAGKTARVLLKRFSVANLSKIKEDRLVRNVLRLSQHISRDTVTKALEEEINKRTQQKQRGLNAVQSTKNKAQEIALQKLTEEAARAKERETIRAQARKAHDAIDIKLKKLQEAKQANLEEEKHQKERAAEIKRTALQLKRAELDQRQQEERLKRLERVRQEAEDLKQADEERLQKNNASYERWKKEKERNKNAEKDKRQEMREKAHEQNLELLSKLHAKLKGQVLSSKRQHPHQLPKEIDTTNLAAPSMKKVPTPPTGELDSFRSYSHPRKKQLKKRRAPKEEDIDQQMSTFFGNKNGNKKKGGGKLLKSNMKMKMKENGHKNQSLLGSSFDFNSLATVNKC